MEEEEEARGWGCEGREAPEGGRQGEGEAQVGGGGRWG